MENTTMLHHFSRFISLLLSLLVLNSYSDLSFERKLNMPYHHPSAYAASDELFSLGVLSKLFEPLNNYELPRRLLGILEKGILETGVIDGLLENEVGDETPVLVNQHDDNPYNEYSDDLGEREAAIEWDRQMGSFACSEIKAVQSEIVPLGSMNTLADHAAQQALPESIVVYLPLGDEDDKCAEESDGSKEIQEPGQSEPEEMEVGLAELHLDPCNLIAKTTDQGEPTYYLCFYDLEQKIKDNLGVKFLWPKTHSVTGGKSLNFSCVKSATMAVFT
ncbi:hypothetical protein EOPP23_10575 [Endozoicomonas sp. OPT23]|uniref:hypothetical protein n=1 Tax=Endozoicomonas sp. OPT23 TaxID=2072845 RepID=UPI00129AA39D|nr:hypothetical protein [Endozoicomonas sp. OPT23]MRI33429.1 hypothetical protein [Endozoicomonas sp. OPT23]